MSQAGEEHCRGMYFLRPQNILKTWEIFLLNPMPVLKHIGIYSNPTNKTQHNLLETQAQLKQFLSLPIVADAFQKVATKIFDQKDQKIYASTLWFSFTSGKVGFQIPQGLLQEAFPAAIPACHPLGWYLQTIKEMKSLNSTACRSLREIGRDIVHLLLYVSLESVLFSRGFTVYVMFIFNFSKLKVSLLSSKGILKLQSSLFKVCPLQANLYLVLLFYYCQMSLRRERLWENLQTCCLSKGYLLDD